MAWHEQPRGTGTLNDGRDHFDLRREGFRLITATFAIGVTLGILLTIIAITAADRLAAAPQSSITPTTTEGAAA